MILLATDWGTLADLATALGTLVLAIATFASVRSASRATRISELALEEQRRPVLTHSRLDDSPQKMGFIDGHWVTAEGGRACAEHVGDVIYLAISLRNVGTGMAVCHGWSVASDLASSRTAPAHRPLEQFQAQGRDIYLPGGDIGMWQGALRDPEDPLFTALAQAIDSGEPVSIELLYSDMVGAQRTVTRFGLVPASNGFWYASMSRHWHLDAIGPRDADRVAGAHQRITAQMGLTPGGQAG